MKTAHERVISLLERLKVAGEISEKCFLMHFENEIKITNEAQQQVMDKDLLIKKGFEEKRIDSTYYYQLGNLCLRFCGLGTGKFYFDYLAGSLCANKEVETEKQLNTLIALF